ncbi:MAG TPA: prepilin peptidase [Candidatus Paceibacterota bacterium]|nr:prepilin peptidase [Candidatus Paceibacterota bacterium]
MSVLASFLFGLIIGSFLNVLILRRSVSSLGGRSHCMSCGTQIAWYDNVPVVSWLLLDGRCRHCKSAISAQYPLVELLTAILFALLGGAPLSYAELFIGFSIIALAIAITVYDLRHTIIPDEWVYPFAILAISFAYLWSGLMAGPVLFVLAGPLIAAPLFLLWLVSGGRWMGLGDAKLALGMGWLLGPLYGFYALSFGFILGAVIALCVLLPLPHIARALSGIVRLSRGGMRFTMKSEVPFGPFLIVATLCIWFLLLYRIPLPL